MVKKSEYEAVAARAASFFIGKNAEHPKIINQM
jgi:hypothetical protein